MNRQDAIAAKKAVARLLKRSPKKPRIKLAAATIAETDRLIARLKATKEHAEDIRHAVYSSAQSHTRRLRSDAYYAWLDDKVARHRILVAEAKRLERHFPREWH